MRTKLKYMLDVWMDAGFVVRFTLSNGHVVAGRLKETDVDEVIIEPDIAGRPGPLTVVVRRSEAALALDLGGDPTTIGIRCPDHPLVRAIASEVGPIAVTSANRHGEPTPPTAADAAAALAGEVAVVVDGGRLDGEASTVVDLTGAGPTVIREGAIPLADVLAAWAGDGVA